MHETSKAVQRRLHDSNFISRYFKGNGIDIGAGNDPLGQYIELFPLMQSCLSYDREDGDAQEMRGIKNEQYDFVHSSHCLEDTESPERAIKAWFRILKPGGHLIITVPDEDMYEQGTFPSTFNPDHKWTFTIFKQDSWSPNSVNLVNCIRALDASAEVIKIERLTGTYRFGLDRQDQTRSPIGEAAIELVIRKRPIVAERASIGQRHVDIPQRPRICLHRPGAIGDIIMTLALVPLLQKKYPEHDIFYACAPEIGKSLTRLMKSAGIKGGFNSDLMNREKMKEFDQVFNLIGYPLQEGYPYSPMAKHLIQYFAAELELEVGPELPYLTLEPGLKPEGLPPNYVTIHPKAGWSHYKNWPMDRWEQVMATRPDLWFYQIGAADDPKLTGANHGFMGKPLDASIDLMAHADLHLGIDSWTNHLTHVRWNGINPMRGIILWGSTQASAAGYDHNINLRLGLHCQPCFREDPKISRMPLGPCINPPNQVYEEPHHACMNDLPVERVLTAIQAVLPNGTH